MVRERRHVLGEPGGPSSRVCIKNIPACLDEDDLLKRHVIMECGDDEAERLVITDCRIVRRKDGRSRHMAFVGFKTSEMASRVVSRLHNTYARTAKLSVEFAFSRAAAPPKHGGKLNGHEEKRTAEAQKAEVDGESEEGSRANDRLAKLRRRKEEFMEAMGMEPAAARQSSGSEDTEPNSMALPNGQAMQQQSDAQTVEATPTFDVATSDMDFVRSKMKTHILDLEDDEEDQNNQVHRNGPGNSAPSESDKDASPHQEMATTLASQPVDDDRLFVRNLPFAATQEDLEESFARFGRILECHLPVDDMKRNKGYAFVRFSGAEAASEAMQSLDGTHFQGRLLHILPAKRANEGRDHEEGRTYKERKDLSRQKEASATTEGWSSTFVRTDAVTENLSERLGLRKGELLAVKDDLTSGDAAVRLALGETRVIEENREYLAGHGIDMEALVSLPKQKADHSQRSSTHILVKNLPFDANYEELRKRFHDVVGDFPTRLLLPPSRTIAVAEFAHANDARKAFRKLAYRRYKSVPLYLEWVPLDAIKTQESGTESREKIGATLQTATSPPLQASHDVAADTSKDDVTLPDSAEPVANQTLYVKNLNFATTTQSLQSHFESAGVSVRAVKIPTKITPVQPSLASNDVPAKRKGPERLTLGYGFVEFEKEDGAKSALLKLQGSVLDGHSLVLKLSSKRVAPMDHKVAALGARPGTKIIVRNVPFQASRTELLKLFGCCGHLKKVRLPKKFDGGHRGFAFVEFLTAQEAQTAMVSLSGTHLYGRHLVLELAENTDQSDSSTVKAKRDASGSSASPISSRSKRGRVT